MVITVCCRRGGRACVTGVTRSLGRHRQEKTNRESSRGGPGVPGVRPPFSCRRKPTLPATPLTTPIQDELSERIGVDHRTCVGLALPIAFCVSSRRPFSSLKQTTRPRFVGLCNWTLSGTLDHGQGSGRRHASFPAAAEGIYHIAAAQAVMSITSPLDTVPEESTPPQEAHRDLGVR